MSTEALDVQRRAASYAYVVLDDQDRIVHVSSALHAELGHWAGHVLWDHLPGARGVYSPCFAEARTSGGAVETTVFYAGRLKRLTAIPGADGLAVHFEELVELDLTCLASLTRSLEAIEDVLAAREHAQPDPRARAFLRALP
jgi:hypothetical protein